MAGDGVSLRPPHARSTVAVVGTSVAGELSPPYSAPSSPFQQERACQLVAAAAVITGEP